MLPEDQNPDNQQEPESPENSQPPTQPTSPPTDARIDAVQQGLNEVRGMMSQLISHAKTQNQAPPVQEPELGSKEFFEKPQILLDRFGEMLNKAVAPLNQFKNDYEATQRVASIKASLRRDPKMAKALEVVGDDTLDAAIATMKAEHINDGAVGGLLLTLYGNTVLNNGGMVPANAGPPKPSNADIKPINDMTPPHLRSGGAPRNPPAPTPQKTQLTAEEERVMQRFGYDINNEEHRKEFKAAADEGESRGNRVRIVGKELL